jgi:hypothetical protein
LLVDGEVDLMSECADGLHGLVDGCVGEAMMVDKGLGLQV